MELQIDSEQQLKEFGRRLGSLLEGGEAIQLVGDVGAGKTTLAKAVAAGMGVTETLSSPSYTLSQVYETPHGLRLAHYDFYRLDDPGILASELADTFADKQTVVVIEWGAIVAGVTPGDHLTISIVPTDETSRRLVLEPGGETSSRLLEQLT